MTDLKLVPYLMVETPWGEKVGRAADLSDQEFAGLLAKYRPSEMDAIREQP